MADYLTTVAQYLAGEEAKKKRKAPAAPRRIFRNAKEGLDTAEVSEDNVVHGRRGDADRSALEAEGYEWLPGEEFSAVVAYPQKPVSAPPGKLPFFSGTPTHEAPAGYSSAIPGGQRWDPKMADTMSLAAGDSRPLSGKNVPQTGSVPRVAGGGKSSRRVDVGLTSAGIQPESRPFQPLAQLAPGAGGERDRLAGLPEGVAKFMRQRSGLEEAQGDANQRAMMVELASAFSQIGHGIGGSKYNNATWDNQRAAARQPVADYQARAEEDRTLAEHERRHNADERAAQEAARAAEMELKRFEYGKNRDADEDKLARERLELDRQIAQGRLTGDAADRALRRFELNLRQTEGKELKLQMAREKEEAKQRREGELDLQRLSAATSKAPFGEFQSALQDIDQMAPGLVYGKTPENLPIDAGDRIARAIPFGAGEWAMSDEAKRYSQAAANLRDLVSRMRSGAVLNTGEERHYLALLGDRALSDPESAAAGINAVRQGIAQKLRNAQAGYAPTGALDTYQEQGGTTYRAPIFNGQASRQVVMVDPEGRQYQVDEGEVAEATRNGWRVR